MMRFAAPLALLIAFSIAPIAHAQTPPAPQPGPDSRPQEGVPKGEVLKFSFEGSRIFPGTYRDYWVYVPAQYTPETPACLYVNQDGIQWQAPVVFDNLIHKKEMPVTVGVFVMHGRVRATDPNAALDRFNRSYEYDGLGDAYARFLLEELLPEVETKKTSDGRPIRLSRRAADRAIGGSSSGAICAFTAAWERPDAFSRVFSAIGTYVGIRGGDVYPTLIRKTEPKPLRIFLQDGSGDLNNNVGDWWMANQTMQRALAFAGYEVQHVWGEGGHSGQHGTAVFPDAMRWLWKDWPQPVVVGQTKNGMLGSVLLPGEGWQMVGEGYGNVSGLAANAQGEVRFHDADGKSYRIGRDGAVAPPAAGVKGASAQAFGPDGSLYALADGGRKVVAVDTGGKTRQIADLSDARAIVASHNGNVYVAGTGRAGGEIALVTPDGKRRAAGKAEAPVSCLTLSPDRTLLYAGDTGSHWVYSYQIQPDGTLRHGQRFYWLHAPDTEDDGGAASLCVDRDGRLYAATAMGVQIADQAGKVNGIVPVPGGRVTGVCLGGEKFDTLYAASGGKLYRRRVKVPGAPAWAPPIKPAAPRL